MRPFKIVSSLTLLVLLGSLLVSLTPSPTLAQTDLKGTLQENINLAPRAKRGDTRSYLLDIQTIFLSKEGSPKQRKHDWINYSKLCLGNGPDTGVTYQITIDSFSVGQKLGIDQKDMGRAFARQFDGKSFTYNVKQNFPIDDGCYGFRINFPEGQRFSQSYEMMEYFTSLNLLEQLRYSAGRRLSKIGDQISMKLPVPICYEIPGVLESSRTEFSSFVLTLEGLSLYRGSPCAIISISPLFAQMSTKFLQPDTTNYIFRGIMTRWGEFRVRLSDGDIVSAVFRERDETRLTPAPEGVEQNASKAYRTMTLTQLF